MTYRLNRHVSYALTALLAVTSLNALSQTPAAAPPPVTGMGHMQQHDPAKMQAMLAKRQTELKAKLNITAAQEPAWSAWTAAMQPPADWKRVDSQAQRAELDRLPTPERIDKMRALHAERMTKMNAEMDKRGAATKSLYAALSAEQQKTFDAERKMHDPANGGHRRHGGADGKRG